MSVAFSKSLEVDRHKHKFIHGHAFGSVMCSVTWWSQSDSRFKYADLALCMLLCFSGHKLMLQNFIFRFSDEETNLENFLNY